VLAKKHLELGNNVISCAKAGPVILKTNTAFDRYIWNTGDTAQEIAVNKSGSYYLNAADECNNETDSVTVIFEHCYCEFFIPNAFTPDGDGLNDVFKPACSCELKKYSLQLFDRWGKLAYSTSDINDSWDGRMSGSAAEQGMYTVKIIYQPEDFYVNSEKIIYSSLMVLK
jgi:gliding motility-associated-like protein